MAMSLPNPLNLLLADDDIDDQFFFAKALNEVPIATTLTKVNDGAQLIAYLNKDYKSLPDAVFLDLNMPRKNGVECLMEIKRNSKLQLLPIIIFSTSLDVDVADYLYKHGAHYYIRKGDLLQLTKVLQEVLSLILVKKFIRPSREKFVYGQPGV